MFEVVADFFVAECREYSGIALAVEVAEDVFVVSVETQLSAASEKCDFVAFVEVFHSVGYDDDCTTFGRKFFEQFRHFEVEVGRKSACGLVEEYDFRFRQQFHCYGHAFALTARKRGNFDLFSARKADVFDCLTHTGFDFVLEHTRTHTQHSGVEKSFFHREVVVHYVFCGT